MIALKLIIVTWGFPAALLTSTTVFGCAEKDEWYVAVRGGCDHMREFSRVKFKAQATAEMYVSGERLLSISSLRIVQYDIQSSYAACSTSYDAHSSKSNFDIRFAC